MVFDLCDSDSEDERLEGDPRLAQQPSAAAIASTTPVDGAGRMHVPDRSWSQHNAAVKGENLVRSGIFASCSSLSCPTLLGSWV